MDVKEMDSMNAIASGLKVHFEGIQYILAHPDKVKSIEKFCMLLRRVAGDFLHDPETRLLVMNIVKILENCDIEPKDLPKFQRQLNYISIEMVNQTYYILNELLGLKVAGIIFMKGPKPKGKRPNLSQYAGVK